MTKNAIVAIGSVCALLLYAPNSFGDALSLSGTSLNVTGPTTLQGSLNVTGSTSVSTLDVTGLASLQDLTLRDLIVSGTTDISGNLLYFGSWLENPDQHGVSLLFTDRTSTSTPSRLTFSATRPLHEWLWEHEKADQSGTVPTMKLDANNVLTIYNAAGNPGIVLDPANIGGPTNVLTQQAADGLYVKTTDYKVGTATSGTTTYPTIALTEGTATGIASFAGIRANATGDYSTAIGSRSIASGSYSLAIGTSSTASGYTASAIGFQSVASGYESTAVGWLSSAGGWGANAIGYHANASGDQSTASGWNAKAIGYASNAIGYQSTANGWGATASGYQSTASGAYSTAAGANITAAGWGQFIVGQYNIPQGNSTSWVLSDELFTVGNGTDATHLSNALLVKKSGDTTVYGKLTVSTTNGSTAATPSGFSIAYNDGTDGAGSSITQQASRPSSVWNWQRTSASGSATGVMQLDASNRLILTGTASANPPQLILDPNGSVSINGSSFLTKTAADSLYLPSSIGLSATNGNVGVGTNTPGAKLQVNVSDANTIGEIIQATTSGTADLQQWRDSDAKVLARIDRSGRLGIGAIPSNGRNIYSVAQYSGTSNTSANQFEATYSSQVDVFDVNYQPVNATLFITSDKRVTQTPSAYPAMSCMMASMAFNGNGNTQKAGGYVSRLGILNNSHTVGDLMNFYASTPYNASGAITNMYGIYIASQKQSFVTNGYGVYQSGTADVNYFAGNLGIGTTTPQSKLDVNGSAKISGNLSISGTGSLTLPDGTTLSGIQTLSNIVSSGTAAYALASTTATALSGAIQASQVNGLATVATTGNYNSLAGLPIIPTNNNQLANGAGYITASGTAAALSGNIQASQVEGIAPVATGGNLDYSKLSNVPTNVSTFTNDAGYITASGTASNLAVSGTTSISGQTNISGSTKISGGIVVTGTAVEVVSGTTKIVASGSAQLVLIPEQGDLSMGDFVKGARPE